MGYVYEKYFDVDVCPKCKSKNFRAVVTTNQVYIKEGENYWEDEMAYDEEDVIVTCANCGEEV